jgi:hypothetical protein
LLKTTSAAMLLSELTTAIETVNKTEVKKTVAHVLLTP